LEHADPGSDYCSTHYENNLSMTHPLPVLQNPHNINTGLEKLEDHVLIAISVDCVIFGFDENELKVLLIRSDLKQYENKWSLLGDLVNSKEDIEEAAYRVLRERTGSERCISRTGKGFRSGKPASVGKSNYHCLLFPRQCSTLQARHTG
jgi:hypothetical protein